MKLDKTVLIAVDFDGTLTKKKSILSKNYKIDKKAIKYIIKMQAAGAKIILWTCRYGDMLINPLNDLKKHKFAPDYINESNGKRPCGRKINADFYIDDKSCLGKIKWKKIYKYIKNLIYKRRKNVYSN